MAVIAHVSEVDVTESTGVGRVSYHWVKELRRRGHHVLCIGPSETGPPRHPSLFPFLARRALQRAMPRPELILAHEPAAYMYTRGNPRLVLFSHGVERRYWQQKMRDPTFAEGGTRLRTKILYPLWRLAGCDAGIKRAHKLLLINQDDREFVQAYYGRGVEDIHVFRNGIDTAPEPVDSSSRPFTVIFNGSWIERKGIRTLVAAATMAAERQLPVRWSLIGTGQQKEDVLRDWPEGLRGNVEVHPSFSRTEEQSFLGQASAFVLPSLFEGQPLSLLQAMAVGVCCITTACCGQKDIIRHRENGLLFEPGRADQLFSLLQLISGDANLRRQLGQAARLSMQHRTWDEVAHETIDEVEKLL